MDKLVKFGYGISGKDDAYEAGKEAARNAIKDIDEKIKFAFIFSSPKYENEWNSLFSGIQEVLGEIPNAGCTTAGTLLPSGVVTEKVAVIAISSKQIDIFPGIGKNIKKNPRKAGSDAIHMALKEIDKRGERERVAGMRYLSLTRKGLTALKAINYAVITFPEGIPHSGTEDEAVEGIKDVIGTSMPIIGGTSGRENLEFDKTPYQFYNYRAYQNSIVCCFISSSIKIGVGIAHGFKYTGKGVFITKARGNIAHEFNDKPALDVAAKIYDTSKDKLKANKGKGVLKYSIQKPFGLGDLEGEFWPRSPIIASEDGSIQYACPVREGYGLGLMEGNQETVLNATGDSIKKALKNAGNPKKVEGVIIFSCDYNHIMLAENAGGEISIAKKILGKNTPIIGFYTWAEEGFTPNGTPNVLNQTIVSLLISGEWI